MSVNDEPISPHIADSQSRENPAPSPGAFFSHARRFVVAGGNFNNITNITHPIPESDPTDFEEIPIGQLDLFHEVRLDEQDHVVQYQVGARVRKMYSARVQGCKSKMLVFTYQGETGEEEWREDILRYSWLRLEFICTQVFRNSTRYPDRRLYKPRSSTTVTFLLGLQTIGLILSGNRVDLIPLREMTMKACVSPVSTVYCWGFLSGVGTSNWMRASTGRLCVILTGNREIDRDSVTADSRILLWTVDDGTSEVFFTEREDPSDTWLRFLVTSPGSRAQGMADPSQLSFQQLHASRPTTRISNIQCGIVDQPVYYWSLDPSGVEQLTEEEVEQLGFPFFQLEMGAMGKYWDGHIYEGLRQFYEGKGFDPIAKMLRENWGFRSCRSLGIHLRMGSAHILCAVEDTGSEYTNTSAESDEEESDENVGDEVANWDTTSVAGEEAESPRVSRVDEVEMLPRSTSFVLVAWCLPSTQIYADQSSGAPAKEYSEKEAPASSELECQREKEQSSAIPSSKKATHSYESGEPARRDARVYPRAGKMICIFAAANLCDRLSSTVLSWPEWPNSSLQASELS
ncbi:hypothetical protein B0H14DRAFT_2653252 [Mycena olivaceomarginata]|nr:hypothetical protein B0H14DRAFT_2653252 [Mycena olivaceomarginata]